MNSVLSPVDRVIVLDLEATCDEWGTVPREEMETIEIGAVALADGWEPVDEFQRFVKPVRHPWLTEYCKQLTHISQEDVERAPHFPEALADLVSWMRAHDATVFTSWGKYDQYQIAKDCAFHRVPDPMPRHVNAKSIFSDSLGIRRSYGLLRALRRMGLEFQGCQHRALEDARNIARLLPLIEKNWMGSAATPG